MNSIARQFTSQRLAAGVLSSFPGEMPETLAQAYAIQDEAIDNWPDQIGGWKIGYIPKPYQGLGADRLVGPIFEKSIQRQTDGTHEVCVFEGGFGAIEGECILVLGQDAPSGKNSYTPAEALALVEEVRLGVEIASSPFSGINEAGPLVTISDFGNNNGLVVGSKVSLLDDEILSDWLIKTFIDGVEVGRGSTSNLPRGPIGAFVSLLENVAARGRPLKRGMYVSTGAITGIHQVAPGQTAHVEAAGAERIDLNISAAPRVISD